MARKKSGSNQLGVRYLDDELVLSESHAWTYLRLPLLAYEFQAYQTREAFADQISLALGSLVTSNQEPVDIHLRLVHRPLDVAGWRRQLAERVARQRPTPGFDAYLAQMTQHVNASYFDVKEVYLGVCLGRRGEGSGAGDLLNPTKFLSSLVEKAVGVTEVAIPDAELVAWKRKARDVHRALGASYLRGVPATAEEVAWVIARSLWPDMEQPPVTVSDVEVWGPGEVATLAQGVVTHHRRMVEVEQLDVSGRPVTGYVATLCVSRFPDVLEFPAQEPWIHFAATAAAPVDFSIRASIVPAQKVQKDVGKKLADAKDQATHIAETGAAVPLKVREQLEVATVLEYTIDKDRMPWAYARHRLIVTGSTPEELTSRAKTLIESYKELGIDLVWPSGDQFDLLVEAMPGDGIRTASYFQRQDLAVISGGMPTASAECGDQVEGGAGWRGPFLGSTTSRVRTPVFFAPHVAMARNRPPGVAITGAPGGGKSFLAFTLAHQMAMQGVWTIYIDPKADAKPMGQLPGLGNPRVFDLRDGNDGMLDPFSLGESRGEATLLALETLRLLLGGSVSEEREEALLNAIEIVAVQPQPSLNKVVDTLVSNTASTAARNLGAVLKTIRELPFARLCFSPTGGAALRPEDGLTVVTLLGLDLPSAQTATDDYSYENRLAVSVMYLLTRYARKLMLNMDKSHPKAICIDEAWAITSTPQGAKLIPEIARMGRSHNTALVLVSQNAGDLMAEAVTNSISTKFAFRSTIPAEINDVMTLMGLPHDQGYQAAVRDLRNGECLMQDVDGRVSRVQVEAWNEELTRTFNTNPETRGRGVAEGNH
jgi:hypothetical protein